MTQDTEESAHSCAALNTFVKMQGGVPQKPAHDTVSSFINLKQGQKLV